MDPQAALGLIGDNSAIADVAREARSRLQKALASMAVQEA
jgi:hypothetical protein